MRIGLRTPFFIRNDDVCSPHNWFVVRKVIAVFMICSFIKDHVWLNSRLQKHFADHTIVEDGGRKKDISEEQTATDLWSHKLFYGHFYEHHNLYFF